MQHIGTMLFYFSCNPPKMIERRESSMFYDVGKSRRVKQLQPTTWVCRKILPLPNQNWSWSDGSFKETRAKTERWWVKGPLSEKSYHRNLMVFVSQCVLFE